VDVTQSKKPQPGIGIDAGMIQRLQGTKQCTDEQGNDS